MLLVDTMAQLQEADGQNSLLSRNGLEYQPQQSKLNLILAGNLYLLSNTCLCLESLCAYCRLYEIEPRNFFAIKQKLSGVQISLVPITTV